jgi:hypothetical protein
MMLGSLVVPTFRIGVPQIFGNYGHHPVAWTIKTGWRYFADISTIDDARLVSSIPKRRGWFSR